MTRTFLRLDEKRQRLLLDICADEFARNGYELASTNAIVREAGISKGLFFKYFTSKETVYLFLLKAILTELGELQSQDYESADIVARSRELLARHLEYARCYPSRYEMALRSSLETEPGIQDAARRIRADVSGRFGTALYDGVDWRMYRLPQDEVVEFLRCLDLGLRQVALECLRSRPGAATFRAFVHEQNRLAWKVLRDGLYANTAKEDSDAH